MLHNTLNLLMIVGAALVITTHNANAADSKERARGHPVDYVLVDKSERKLQLIGGGGIVLREYSVSLGDAPQGHKRAQGDERTPVGTYYIDYKKPDSSFYRALRISYPNAKDRANAAKIGVSPGGNIMIHGQPNKLERGKKLVGDWTDGCIALANHEMEEIWRYVRTGTPIIIRE